MGEIPLKIIFYENQYLLSSAGKESQLLKLFPKQYLMHFPPLDGKKSNPVMSLWVIGKIY